MVTLEHSDTNFVFNSSITGRQEQVSDKSLRAALDSRFLHTGFTFHE